MSEGRDRFGYGQGRGVQLPEGQTCHRCGEALVQETTHCGPDLEYYCSRCWQPLFDEWVRRVYDNG